MKFLFPNGKIHAKYLNFLKWSSFSNLIISIESVLASHSMLSSFGVNDNSNLSLNYISKDIVGQMGGLLIMNKISKKIDDEPSKFLKYSMIFQQTATIAECMTPLFPSSSFIFIASSSNIVKSITFMNFGAINAKVINKLSLDKDNIAEIYTKMTIINTISTSIGMSIGLGITILFPCHYTRLLFLPFLGMLRYYSFYRSIYGIF